MTQLYCHVRRVIAQVHPGTWKESKVALRHALYHDKLARIAVQFSLTFFCGIIQSSDFDLVCVLFVLTRRCVPVRRSGWLRLKSGSDMPNQCELLHKSPFPPPFFSPGSPQTGSVSTLRCCLSSGHSLPCASFWWPGIWILMKAPITRLTQSVPLMK